MARWLEANIPEAVVYYGGDSSGVLYEPFHRETREALMDHFLKHGHAPYRDYFDPRDTTKKGNLAHQSRPVCPSGDCGPQSLHQYGFGKDYVGLRCAACGLDVWTRDNGETWMAGNREIGGGDDEDVVLFQMTDGVNWDTA